MKGRGQSAFCWLAMMLVSWFLLPRMAYAQGADPYAAYLNAVPHIKQVISEAKDSDITTRRFTFVSHKNENVVYAILAYPEKKGIFPALLILHGGGSKAEDLANLIIGYARRGYVAMAFDMPGICNAEKTPNSSGVWKSRRAGEGPRFDIAAGTQNSTLVDAEVAGLESFNFLSAQPDVDKKHIGITGFSWGGYSTTILSGLLGKKVKAAYSVFGSGFYDKGSFWKKLLSDLPDSIRMVWLAQFDAGRRAAGIKAPYFLEASSNDTYFWPEAVSATLHSINGPHNHVWDPNFNHRQMPEGPAMQQLYFDYYLKGVGLPFGTVSISKEKATADQSKTLTITARLPDGIANRSVILYYSEPAENWQSRVWVPLTAEHVSGNDYSVVLSADLIKKGVSYYACLTDSRGVTVSSEMSK